MPPELWELVKSYGTAAPLVGFLLWWGFGERTDRRDAQEKLLKVTGEAIEAEKDMTQALNLLAGKISK